MNRKEKSLCFGGHRSEKLPQSKEELENLKQKLWEEIDNAIANGTNIFYFGTCYGFELMCAEIILKRKKVIKMSNPQIIKLIAVVPFEEQAKRWSEDNRDIYYNTLAECDDVITLNKIYKKGCYHERNRYMVDNSSKMICYYDCGEGGTAYIIAYAEKNHLQIINLYNQNQENQSCLQAN